MSHKKQARESALDAFAIRAEQILKEFNDAPEKARTPFESRWGAFKREAYRLIRSTKSSAGGHKIVKSLVKTFDREPARLMYEGNEFHWGLIAIDPDGDVLDRKRISLLARQLTYADVHDVPAHYLVGFLHQSGSSASTSKKLRNGEREPWFRGQR